MAFKPLESFLRLAIIISSVQGFNFSVGQVGECDPLSLLWSGGQPPFQLLIIPPGGIMKNISIPASAFNSDSGQGSYSVPELDLAEGVSFMASMSDATGIFSGGTSSLFTVGASRSGQMCNTTYPGLGFSFSMEANLAQCSPLPLVLYGDPVLPVRLLVNIPLGRSFVVDVSADSTWIANVTAGTPVAFTVLDARNRNGGTANLGVVQPTNNASCLSSMASITSLASSASLETSSTSIKPMITSGSESQPTHNDVGALVVGVLVGVSGFLCISSICIWYYRRKRRARSRALDLTHFPSDSQVPFQTPYLRGASPAPSHSVREIARISSDSSRDLLALKGANWTHAARGPTTGTWSSSGVFVHADILDGPLEVPPRYSAYRPPLPSALFPTGEQP